MIYKTCENCGGTYTNYPHVYECPYCGKEHAYAWSMVRLIHEQHS